MELANECTDTEISQYINNLDDLYKLFQSKSPALFTFLSNCFDSNRFVDEIKYLQMPKYVDYLTITDRHSGMSEDIMEG